jgi:hypothetical protein
VRVRTRITSICSASARSIVAVAVFAAIALFASACGDDGQEASSSSTQATTTTTPVKPDSSPQENSKAAAPGVPTSKQGDNSIQTWGLEASSAERTHLTTVVQAFLDARAEANWARACSYLAAEQRKGFEDVVKKSGTAACAEGMAAFANEVPVSAFAHEAEILKVLSLRVGGGHAFLIYTRPGGRIYATALGREGSVWKVISVGPTALN